MWGVGQSCLGSLPLQRHAIKLRTLGDWRSHQGQPRFIRAAKCCASCSLTGAAAWSYLSYCPLPDALWRQKKQACPD